MSDLCPPQGDPATARYLVIDDAPGKEELAQGKPCVGSYGRVFWSQAKKAGIDRAECLVAYAVPCWPANKSGSPSKAQIYEHWDRLDDVLRAFKGSVVITIGSAALLRVTGMLNQKGNPLGVLDARGYVIQPRDFRRQRRRKRVVTGYYKRDCKSGKKGDPKRANKLVVEDVVVPPNMDYLIPVLDPEGIARSAYATIPALRADLGRAARAAAGNLDLIDMPSYGQVAVHPPISAKRVTIDIETPMPPNDWVIERVSLAWSEEGKTVCWTAPWTEHTQTIIQAVMANASIIKCFHNRSFDIPRLDAAGCPAKGTVLDTMWGAQTMLPDLAKGLGRCATIYLDVTPWKDSSTADPKGYSAKDAYVQHALGEKLFPALKATGQWDVYMAQMRGLPVVEAMTRRGIRCDRERTRVWVGEQEDALMEASLRWPWPDVSFASYPQVRDHLYFKLNLPKQYDKKGSLTTDEAAVMEIVRQLEARRDPQHEILDGLQALLDMREASRNIKYYGSVVVGEDDCVHPQYLPTSRDEHGSKDRGQGARTSRIQPRNPNIANQHADARCLYIPRRDDWSFVAGDWSQAEAWVDAIDADDTNLMEALEGDLHDYIVKGLEELLQEHIERLDAKMTWYSTRNLAAPRTICTQLRRNGRRNATTAGCKKIQDGLFKLFPKWAARRWAVIKTAEARFHVRAPFGRRYPVFCRGRLAPRIVGFRPQAAVAHMLWDRLPVVEEAAVRHGGFLTLTVHDEFICEIPSESAAPFADELKGLLEVEWPELRNYHIPADVEVGLPGEAWGDMGKRYKEMAS